MGSHSTENLACPSASLALTGSPVRRRWTRRSIRRSRVQNSSPETDATDAVAAAVKRQEEEAERLMRAGEEELRLHLDNLGHQQRVITAHEAKALVALLHSNDANLLEKTLTTIGNCGTFTANQ
ncbi:hypothetical protein J437_LFUL006978, partial [Ladona fulva]